MWRGAEAFPGSDSGQGAHYLRRSLICYRISVESWHRLAGHSCGGNVNRTPRCGRFLWQEYNALIYEHIILCIVTIGVVGFVLDRFMSAIERRFRSA